jgi:plasmid stability protein
MSNLIIEMPDDLARNLQVIAAAQHRSVQELAIGGLRSLVDAASEHRAGSPGAVLQAMLDAPHLATSDVDEFDAVLAAGRLPTRTRDIFPE